MHLLRNINHCVVLLLALIPARLISAQTSCTDDRAFQFVTKNSFVTVNCAWLNKNTNNSAKRKSMYCDDPSIMDACSASCGACGRAITCEDTNDFMFELNFSGKSVGCDWFTKRKTEERTGKYCVESGDFFDAEIANGCVASCGLCEDDAPPKASTAPASGPTSSCQDSTDRFRLDFNNKQKGCRWAAGNPTVRCNKNPTRQECPETCGSCGETTTAFTQGPTATAESAPRTTPKPTQGPTLAPVSTPERTPAPTQGPTAAAATICPYGKSPFTITLMNMGNNTKFDAAFASAKAKWESIIKCNLEDYWVGFGSFDWFNGQFSEPFNGAVDGVVIGFSMEYIDGTDRESNALGSAGAVHIRGQGGSPVSGVMVFDEDDFATMSQSESGTMILY